jgi:hypothetical protein
MKHLASLFFLLLMVPAPGLADAGNSDREIARRFAAGATKTQSSLQERLVENGACGSAGEVEGAAERAQRLAAAYAGAVDASERRRHWKALQGVIQEIVREKAVFDSKPASAHGSTGAEAHRRCRIVNYGKPPGIIHVDSGCFHRQCDEIRGKFSVRMGWGVSGGDGPMAEIDMTVTVDGDRAVIHRSGFQTMEWFENAAVGRKGPVVLFSHDEATTFAMGARDLARPVSGHPSYGAEGEYFSLMLPPDGTERAMVHFGILEPENVLRRVCE